MKFEDQYKRSMCALHTPSKVDVEEIMNQADQTSLKKYYFSGRNRSIRLAVMAAALIIAVPSAAFAADLGGVRTQALAWIQGQQREVSVTSDQPGQFSYEYMENGETITGSGGGVAILDDGTEVPLSAEEYLSTLDQSIDRLNDGSIVLSNREVRLDLSQVLVPGKNLNLEVTTSQSTYYYIISLEEQADGFGYSCSLNPEAGTHYEKAEDLIEQGKIQRLN